MNKRLAEAIARGTVAPSTTEETAPGPDCRVEQKWIERVHFRPTMKSRAGKPKNRGAHRLHGDNQLRGKVRPAMSTVASRQAARGTAGRARLVKKG